MPHPTPQVGQAHFPPYPVMILGLDLRCSGFCLAILCLDRYPSATADSSHYPTAPGHSCLSSYGPVVTIMVWDLYGWGPPSLTHTLLGVLPPPFCLPPTTPTMDHISNLPWVLVPCSWTFPHLAHRFWTWTKARHCHLPPPHRFPHHLPNTTLPLPHHFPHGFYCAHTCHITRPHPPPVTHALPLYLRLWVTARCPLWFQIALHTTHTAYVPTVSLAWPHTLPPPRCHHLCRHTPIAFPHHLLFPL